MSLRAAFTPRGTSLVLALTCILLPASAPHIERNTTMDITLVRKTECEYRGITASFEAVTQAYALKTYEQATLLRWEARTSPHNPNTESLITGVFTAENLKISPPAAPQNVSEARHQALPSFGVTWRLSTLGAIQITAHNIYAQDALAVYRQTVDGFIAQMVLVTASTVLREGPGPDHGIIADVELGTILLQEDQQQQWGYVRIPSSRTFGWIEKEHLNALDHVQ